MKKGKKTDILLKDLSNFS